jgi:hypothetical protein
VLEGVHVAGRMTGGSAMAAMSRTTDNFVGSGIDGYEEKKMGKSAVLSVDIARNINNSRPRCNPKEVEGKNHYPSLLPSIAQGRRYAFIRCPNRPMQNEL